MIEADSVHSTPPLSMPTDVNKHRSGTPGLREANRLIWFVNLADNRGPDGPIRTPPQTNFLVLHQSIAVI